MKLYELHNYILCCKGEQNMKTKHQCRCNSGAFVEIDSEQNSLICGIVGMTDFSGVHIHAGVATCALCKGEVFCQDSVKSGI